MGALREPLDAMHPSTPNCDDGNTRSGQFGLRGVFMSMAAFRSRALQQLLFV